MYCTWESIDTDGPQMTDHRRHTLNLSYYLMMCQRFGKKHKFLESSLELLQQFHIGLVSLSDEFRLFPGDCSTFSLECTQCGKYVSPPGSIGMPLFIAPYAILSHLGLKFLNEDHTTNITKEEDPSVNLNWYQSSSHQTSIMPHQLLPILIYLNPVVIQSKTSTLAIVVLFNQIDPKSFCSVKLSKLMHRYQTTIARRMLKALFLS